MNITTGGQIVRANDPNIVSATPTALGTIFDSNSVSTISDVLSIPYGFAAVLYADNLMDYGLVIRINRVTVEGLTKTEGFPCCGGLILPFNSVVDKIPVYLGGYEWKLTPGNPSGIIMVPGQYQFELDIDPEDTEAFGQAILKYTIQPYNFRYPDSYHMGTKEVDW